MAKSMMYTVHDPIKLLYIHYNPHTKEYIVSNKEIGAIAFNDKESANFFIRETNIGHQFFAKEIVVHLDFGISRDNALKLYDDMPH